MKKISKVLLMALIICLMMTCFCVEAFAAKDYSPYSTQVTIQAGDTVSDICKYNDMDYLEVRDAILILNGVSKDDSLGVVKPGDKVYIPKSTDDAEKIVKLYNAVISAVIPLSYVQKYTVMQGDNMYAICGMHHLDFDTCRQAIKDLNKWADDSSLNNLQIGQEFYLPVSNEAAKEIAVTVAKAVDANINISTTSGDHFEYYLVAHTMAAGETVKSVCDGLGVKYSESVENMLKTINGVQNLSSVQARKTYLFPSQNAENAVYAVYSHKIVNGDTVNELCETYEVDYAKVNAVLQGLNPKTNMSSIKKDAEILLVAECGIGAETPIIIR